MLPSLNLSSYLTTHETILVCPLVRAPWWGGTWATSAALGLLRESCSDGFPLPRDHLSVALSLSLRSVFAVLRPMSSFLVKQVSHFLPQPLLIKWSVCCNRGKWDGMLPLKERKREKESREGERERDAKANAKVLCCPPRLCSFLSRYSGQRQGVGWLWRWRWPGRRFLHKGHCFPSPLTSPGTEQAAALVQNYHLLNVAKTSLSAADHSHPT